VVTDADGAEVARLAVTTEAEPFAALHNFDGSRLLVSREPFEPVQPARTFLVIDLNCLDCTESFQNLGSAASAALL
jgi:hypothetical protein